MKESRKVLVNSENYSMHRCWDSEQKCEVFKVYYQDNDEWLHVGSYQELSQAVEVMVDKYQDDLVVSLESQLQRSSNVAVALKQTITER
ncbi:hypothetical protein A1D22_09340 [Pasteurellaceae bacterium LFhippo2]|nr:hypothetical protein [Pasteurellaceae bacterium LFhippo2]